ncbi:MAG: phage tail protein I [Phycisphaerae bacterium]|nr:phage tail protein I [Phycisphaerae bacterium]
MSDLPTILKPNATEHDRALEQAIRKGKPDLTPIAKLMNPDTCPAHLLGWLAWAFSVDVWEATWSEATKREVINRSIAIHRIKGTAGAVRRALGTIGFRTDISEWFEHGGTPHTFRIDAFGDDIFAAGFQISAELVDMVTLLIENVKPVRAHFTLRIGEKKGGTVTLRTGSLQRAEDHRHITPALPVDTHAPQLTARTGHRGRAISREIHRFDMGDAA